MNLKDGGTVAALDNTMENRRALKQALIRLWFGAFLLVFISSIFIKFTFSIVYLCLFFGGVFGAFGYFWHFERAPNVLVHLNRTLKRPDTRSADEGFCKLCKDTRENLERNASPSSSSVTLPENVNAAIEEFLEIALEKFVYTWSKKVSHSESVVDELRIGLQHIAVNLTQRTYKLDIPALVLNKMVAVCGAHLHYYMLARMKNRRASFEPMDRTLSKLTLAEYGCSAHWAVRAPLTDLQYCQKLLNKIMPFVLPAHLLESDTIRLLLGNVLANKIMVPAVDFAAKMDNINKLLLLIADRNSQTVQGYGPHCRPVIPLCNFAKRRQPLSSPIFKDLHGTLNNQKHLYSFMSFLKSSSELPLIQCYMELRACIHNQTTSNSNVKKMLLEWRERYILQRQSFFLEYEQSMLDDHLTEIMELEDLQYLMKSDEILQKTLETLYVALKEKCLPVFHKTDEYFSENFGSRLEILRNKEANERLGKSIHRLVDKARTSSPMLTTRKFSHSNSDKSEDGSFEESEVNEGADPLIAQQATRVQIVHYERHTEGVIVPYIAYVIVSWQHSESGKDCVRQVTRRYREFVGLDEKLQHFYGNLGISLPPKRTMGNMDKEFLEKRKDHLELYLNELIKRPNIRDSHILQNFLLKSSQTVQFTPHSRAGKVLKHVPNMLKKEKGKNLDVYLKDMIKSLEVSSSPLISKPATGENRHDKAIEKHQKALEDSRARLESSMFMANTGGDVPHLTGFYELLLFLGGRFLAAPKWMMSIFSTCKFLCQNTVETLAMRFLQKKVAAITYDKNLIHIIHLLRDNIFNCDSVPRTVQQISERQAETISALTDRTSGGLVHLFGKENVELGVWMLFMSLQSQQLNKQLIYCLLDEIVEDLFPEIIQR